jgi:hypothetical protein
MILPSYSPASPPSLPEASWTATNASLIAGGSRKVYISLTSPAPPGGLEILLGLSNSVVGVSYPKLSISITEGRQAGFLEFTGGANLVDGEFTVYILTGAGYLIGSPSALTIVTDSAGVSAPPEVSWAFSTATLNASGSTLLSVSLPSPAPSPGITVGFSSTVLPSGATLAATSISVASGQTTGSVLLSGSAGLQAGSVTFTLEEGKNYTVGVPSELVVTSIAAPAGATVSWRNASASVAYIFSGGQQVETELWVDLKDSGGDPLPAAQSLTFPVSLSALPEGCSVSSAQISIGAGQSEGRLRVYPSFELATGSFTATLGQAGVYSVAGNPVLPVTTTAPGSGTPTVSWITASKKVWNGRETVLTAQLSAPAATSITVPVTASGLPVGVTAGASITFPRGHRWGYLAVESSATGSGTGTLTLPSGSVATVQLLSSPPSTVNGSTGLTAGYRTPGVDPHYVIDLSADGFVDTAWREAVVTINSRSQLPSNDPDFIDMSIDPVIAVLFPPRLERKSMSINTSAPNSNYERADFTIGHQRCQIHFVAPWVAGESDTKAVAMKKVADRDPSLSWDYSIWPVDISGNALPGPGGGYAIKVDLEQTGFQGSLEFWCMEIGAVGRTSIALGTAPLYIDYSRVNGEVDIHFHLCDFHQDGISFDLGPSSNVPFWGVSTWNIRLHLHGWYSDLPFNQEHHIYNREEPYGDMVYEFLNLDRCGGQLVQKAGRRFSDFEGSPLIRGILRTSPGTVYYLDMDFETRCGRWAGKASAWFTTFSNHQAQVFERIRIAETDTDNCSNTWPPAGKSAAQILSGDIADRAYNFTNGSTAWTFDNPDRDAPGDDGYFLGPLRMRECYWYSRRPTKDFVDIRSHPSVDIEDCGFFCGVQGEDAFDTGGPRPMGTQSKVGVGNLTRQYPFTPTYLIGPFRWVGNCTEPMRLDLIARFGLNSPDVTRPNFKFGANASSGGSGVTCADDITFDGFIGPNFVAGVDPVNFTVS